MTAGLASAQEMKTIKTLGIGCLDKAVAGKLLDFLAEKDQDAFSKLYYPAMASGVCRAFKAGDKVFLEDTSFFEGLVCVRPKGSLSCLWLALEMIE
jgi:hypothetical protein